MLGSDTFSKKGCYVNPSLVSHVNRGPFLGGGRQLVTDAAAICKPNFKKSCVEGKLRLYCNASKLEYIQSYAIR